jgi:hypothetical protein
MNHGTQNRGVEQPPWSASQQKGSNLSGGDAAVELTPTHL